MKKLDGSPKPFVEYKQEQLSAQSRVVNIADAGTSSGLKLTKLFNHFKLKMINETGRGCIVTSDLHILKITVKQFWLNGLANLCKSV